MHKQARTFSHLRLSALGLALAIAACAGAFALTGCTSSLDAAFIKSAGEHGTQLEKVYALYSKDVLSKVSNRDLKDINAALAASDLKKATAGDLRRAEAEIASRIETLEEFERDLKAENQKLKKLEIPDFDTELGDDVNSKEFDAAYRDSTNLVEKYTTADLKAVKVVFTSLEKYLDFLEQWEEYLTDDDTSNLVETGEASDKALARVNKLSARLKSRGTLTSKLDPQADKMALAASNSDTIADFVLEMKEKYPKSYIAKHVVEKK